MDYEDDIFHFDDHVTHDYYFADCLMHLLEKLGMKSAVATCIDMRTRRAVNIRAAGVSPIDPYKVR